MLLTFFFDTVVRDDFAVAAACVVGNLIALVSKKVFCLDCDIVEPKAVRVGILEAVKHGWPKLVVRGDSLNAINPISKRLREETSVLL